MIHVHQSRDTLYGDYAEKKCYSSLWC